MPLTRFLFALPLLSGLAACVAPVSPEPDYAFVGRWQCGAGVYSFTNATYHDGKESLPITAVRQDGANFLLYLPKGQKLALGAVTSTGMTWVSTASGGQVNCQRR